MPTLPELQRAFAGAVREMGQAPDYVLGDGATAETRLDIYRSAYLKRLTATLRLTYPATDRLVGAEFFDGAAELFIAEHPPQSGNLNDYGQGFADFLAGFAPAQSVAYLADVARLEWAVSAALTAPDAGPLDLASLAEIPEERLRFAPHPSVALLNVDYPADDIWRATLSGDDAALGALKPAPGPVKILVAREFDEIAVTRLDEEEFRFITALCGGESLVQALEGAGGLDVSAALARHLAAGHLAGII